MSWKVDVINEKEKILVVGKKNNSLLESFLHHLKKLGKQYFFSQKTPSFLKKFDYLFHFSQDKIEFINIKNEKKKTILIKKGSLIDQKNFDRILWFCFSKSKINQIELILPTQRKIDFKKIFFPHFPFKRKKIMVIFSGLLILFYLLGFFPFILLANWHHYQALKKIEKQKKDIEFHLNKAKKYLLIGKKLYSLSQPIYLFFGIGIATNNFVDFTIESQELLSLSLQINHLGKDLLTKINQKLQNETEFKNLLQQINFLNLLLRKSEEKINRLAQKAPFFVKKNKKFQEKMKEINFFITTANKIIPYLPSFLGEQKQKRYLILFANNRELRPGGGFIGSFAIADFYQLHLNNFTIYDVYDADGQLKVHIEPPLPIAQYLHQPHWFLRDSAFSVDFPTNCNQAQFFLEKEMNFSNFDGCILITTTAVEKILSSFGDLYIPDYKEKVNSQNFYLKAQLYSEKNFFPGSIQKKSFLNAVSDQVLINLEKVSLSNLLLNLKNALEEKQIVLYFSDEKIQKIIDSFFWSGRLTIPHCVDEKKNCINHLLFPFDANLGVNKADYFVNRSFYLTTTINYAGEINNLLTLIYQNTSPSEIFPGGTYKNYFQIYLPPTSEIKSITKNGILVEDYQQDNEYQLKKIGFYFEVPPKRTTEIKIQYRLSQSLVKGKNIFQLVVEKQIGANNKDFFWRIILPPNITPATNNFSPLVKDNEIIYNTILTTDKIFFIELIKI